MTKDEEWMQIAINEARIAKEENEVPVGAVLVKHNKIIAKARNQPISKSDPTAHAEIQLIRSAGKKLNNYRLVGSSLYVTLEPCIMCIGAMMHARIERLVYGAYDNKKGTCSSSINMMNTNYFNHKIDVSGGILEYECKQLLDEFFLSLR